MSIIVVFFSDGLKRQLALLCLGHVIAVVTSNLLKSKIKLTRRKIACQVTGVFINN